MRDQEVSRYRGFVSDQVDLLWNQQLKQMILSSESLLIVEQLFTARPDVKTAAEPDDPEFGDSAHCRAALHRPVTAPVAKEATESAVDVSQIVGAAKAAETPGAARVAPEAAENVVETSQIIGATKAAETPGAAPDAKEAAENAVEALRW